MKRSSLIAAVGVAVAFVLAAGCTSGEVATSQASAKARRGTTTTTTTATTTSTTPTSTSIPPTTTTAPPQPRAVAPPSTDYSDPAHWVCRPDLTDICDSGLESTVVNADGSLRSEPWTPDPAAPIDCFYLYPTISRDLSANSDLVPSPNEEGFAALNQVARLGSSCRVFAPVYRQITLVALAGMLTGSARSSRSARSADRIAFADVVAAWKYYLANDNGGRGVILIGHSQGSGMLIKLMKSEIDPIAAVRRRLVSAFIAGASVRVPAGADVGGDFAHIGLCRSVDQVGCVVSWASFRSTAPPPEGSLFGRPRGSGGGVSACVNPAALAGGPAELHSYFTIRGGAVLGGGTEPAWVDPTIGTVTTPFVQLPGLVTGECVTTNGFNYLSITVHGDPADPRVDDVVGDISPPWGLHLQDVNLVMGDIVRLVAAQSAAYLNRG